MTDTDIDFNETEDKGPASLFRILFKLGNTEDQQWQDAVGYLEGAPGVLSVVDADGNPQLVVPSDNILAVVKLADNATIN
jgi:hypothetical protein